MSLLNNILSSIDPAATSKSPAPSSRQTQAASAPRPPPRPASAPIGTSQPHAQTLKRKAEGQPDGGQVKVQRKEGTPQAARPNGLVRPAPTPDATRAKPSAPTTSIPYRGTAGGVGAVKPANTAAKKPSPAASTPTTLSRPAAPAPKTSGVAPVPGAAPAAAKKGSYAAMLQRAKEVQQANPVAPPIKHEPTKILTKKERMALKAEASAAAKGKKPGLAGPARVPGVKGEVKEKRKPAELGYQGTARPAKKPVEIGYKGTARPAATSAGPAGRAGGPAATKAKPKPGQGRYGGYASWSEEDDAEEEVEEEDDYDSGSDMEGGLWDVEEEETLALKAAKKEDAEALAEENRLKREKEERKKRLAAMNKAAAGKRKY